MIAKTGSCSEVSSSEERVIGISKGRRKMILRIQMKNLMEAVAMRKRLNNLSVV